MADVLVEGDAADRRVLARAGLADAASVVLTTNDDAMNIYLAVYCRRLEPDLRIVSRITHERNVERRRGLRAELCVARCRKPVRPRSPARDDHPGRRRRAPHAGVPPQLVNRTLQEGAIGTLPGLVVIALQDQDQFITELHSGTRLPEGAELVMIGNLEQRRAFAEAFGQV